MSLFSSAFDDGPSFGAGPSRSPKSVQQASSKGVTGRQQETKTKARPSTGQSHQNESSSHRDRNQQQASRGSRPSEVRDQKKKKLKGNAKPQSGQAGAMDRIEETKRNLEKLMTRLDGGIREDKEDARPMGSGNGNKKRKKAVEKERQDHDASSSLPKTKHPSAGSGSTPKRAKVNPGKVTPGQTTSGSVSGQTTKKSEPGVQGLTKMQKGMQTKLEEARFRWINEQLYSNSSSDAVEMMKKDPKVFSDYHSTHRILTAAWPTPPLPYILEKLTPLPAKTVIIDLGCGDASLAQELVPRGKTVLSFDLVGDSRLVGVNGERSSSTGGWVVEADFLNHIPLPGRSGRQGSPSESRSEVVDVAVCCLSLMGTNWVGGIYEVCRVLKQGGTFHIAEVTSRLVSNQDFVDKISSFGFELVEMSSPSTHFTLFEFTKTTAVPYGPVKGEVGWSERVSEGESIMKGCVYKKR